MQNHQWQHLLQQLKTYTGQYECHLTIEAPPERYQTFRQLCQTLNVKPIIIQLASGNTPTQPMLSRIYRSDPDETLKDIQHLYMSIQQHFTVIRVKVEAGIENTNIPQSDDKATALAASCYFEHHVKIQLPANTHQSSLRLDLQDYHGHLSRNAIIPAALDSSGSMIEHRFVTQRFRRGNAYAQSQMTRLLDYLEQRSISYDKAIREFNIFDSHIALDAGWMNT